MTLSEISAGRTVKLLEVCGGHNVCSRINRMGLTTDSLMKVVRNDKSGPVIIEQDGCRIVIGRGVASRINVSYA
ncbi:MAG: FeoA family protein [bacterium]|nr:FeoA family protein [bacterium]